jgi:hypothetical protein
MRAACLARELLARNACVLRAMGGERMELCQCSARPGVQAASASASHSGPAHSLWPGGWCDWSWAWLLVLTVFDVTPVVVNGWM